MQTREKDSNLHINMITTLMIFSKDITWVISDQGIHEFLTKLGTIVKPNSERRTQFLKCRIIVLSEKVEVAVKDSLFKTCLCPFEIRWVLQVTFTNQQTTKHCERNSQQFRIPDLPPYI